MTGQLCHAPSAGIPLVMAAPGASSTSSVARCLIENSAAELCSPDAKGTAGSAPGLICLCKHLQRSVEFVRHAACAKQASLGWPSTALASVVAYVIEACLQNTLLRSVCVLRLNVLGTEPSFRGKRIRVQ